MKVEPVAFGPLLRQYRIAAGLTQETLAERTGLGVRSIQHLEGGAHLPHRETVDRLSRVLELSGEERHRFEHAAQPTARPRVGVSPARVAGLDDRTPPRAPRHNLPAQLTSFIGRERELGEVKRVLGSTRLLTITGAGGSGKTRLVLQVAADILGAYPDGVWFVDLAPLADPSFVPQTVATAVGVMEQPGEPIRETLLRVLCDQELLLILDNCEHLVDACARLAETVLRGCSRLRILATSRESLGIAGEIAWRLPSLPVPAADWQVASAEGGPTNLVEFDAVRLFAERARAADLSFALTDQNAAAVVQICRQVAGLPLALELAAAWVKVFSVERIAARLDDLFQILTGGNRTALPRHQTMRALIDWSYNLLREPERLLFRRLSVFVGGCAYEAIEAVGAGEGIEEREVPNLLRRLVDHSLVERGDHERYRLLEPLRQYGWDRLVEAGEADVTRDRHRDWFLALAERAKPELIGPNQVYWLDRLEGEHDNLRAAQEWTLERGPAILGLRLVGTVWRLWFARDYLGEGRDLLARALAVPGAGAPMAARAEALDGACELAFHLGDEPAVLRYAEESLAIRRILCDRRGIAWALHQLATRARNAGDASRAEELETEALEFVREAGASWVMAQIMGGLGDAARIRGDYFRARPLLDKSLRMMRDLGDLRAIVEWLWSLGQMAGEQGDYVAARTYFQEALAISHELRSRFRISLSVVWLGGLALIEEDFEQARNLLEESLTVARRSGSQVVTGHALLYLGSMARAQGDLQRAESLAKESLSAFRDSGYRSATFAAIGACGALAITRGAYQRGTRLLGAGSPGYAGLWWLLPDDRRFYDESLATARAGFSDADFATAWSEGQAMTLEQAIADALADDGT